MDDTLELRPPRIIEAVEQKTVESGFGMPSSRRTCSLLRSLVGSKPGGRFLELGTGTGLGTAWMLDGMDDESTLESIDHDIAVQRVARLFLADDQRLTLHLIDGDEFIPSLVEAGKRFDLIFADAWSGKFRLLDETIGLLSQGGFYVVDDLLPQPNWDELDADYDHHAAVRKLIQDLQTRTDSHVTKLGWDTGIIVGVKK